MIDDSKYGNKETPTKRAHPKAVNSELAVVRGSVGITCIWQILNGRRGFPGGSAGKHLLAMWADSIPGSG